MRQLAKRHYKTLYQKMFLALQSGDSAAANKFRAEMETVRQSHIAKVSISPEDLVTLSPFVSSVLDKTQTDLGISLVSNCINAAFNYHDEVPVWAPYSTSDFLSKIRLKYIQRKNRKDLATGDLVVFWSRSGNHWRDRKILVSDLVPEHPEFPFGLVFDHIAVYVSKGRLFHKPDPTFESRYQVNEWEDVVDFNKALQGFELTFHRITSG